MGMTSSTTSSRCSISTTENLQPLPLDFGLDTITRGGYGKIKLSKDCEMMEEGVDVEDFYVCDFRSKFASPGQPCQGVHQDSQVCNKNHIFVTSLARFIFVTGLASFLCLRRTKLVLGLLPYFTSFV